MGKKCVFYYAVVVEGDGTTHWSTPGTRWVEPITLARGQRGLSPDYCCQAFTEAYREEGLVVSGGGRDFGLRINNRLASFCPFCGAAMEYREHLKLRSLLVERTITAYESNVIEGR